MWEVAKGRFFLDNFKHVLLLTLMYLWKESEAMRSQH